MSFLKDGVSAAEVRVAFDYETVAKHDWVGRGAGLLPSEARRLLPARLPLARPPARPPACLPVCPARGSRRKPSLLSSSP